MADATLDDAVAPSGDPDTDAVEPAPLPDLGPKLAEVAEQNAERVKELEAKVEELSASLGALHERPGEPASVDDQMRDLLRLSELISVQYNPFLREQEPSLYDNQDVRRFLPKQEPEVRPGSEVVRLPEADAPASSGPAMPAPAIEPMPGADVVPPAGMGPVRDDDQGMHHDDPGGPRAVEAEEGVASETTLEPEGLDTNAPGSHESAPEAMTVDAAPPSADQFNAPAESLEQLMERDDQEAARDMELDEPEVERMPEPASEPHRDLEPPVELDAAPESPTSRPPRPASRRVLHGPSPRQSHHVLRWFERLANDGDPSEVHLFIDHYARLGWIPSQHAAWMEALADSVAPRRDDLGWDDLHMASVDLARLHRRHLRFLQRLFNDPIPQDDPRSWDREADALLEDD